MNIGKLPTKRLKIAKSFWLAVATDLAAGLLLEEIRARHINPATGKPYSKSHLYWVVKQLKTRII